MATLIMTPSRTPLESLESLDVGRVRSWQQANAINDNLMNQFKGAITLPLKRSATPDSDAENVDPSAGKQPVKRKRSDEGDDELEQKPSKYPRTLVNTVESSPVAHEKLPRGGRVHRASTPVALQVQKPVGRSPPPKSSKAFGRRLEKAGKRNACRAPFSISAVLSDGKRKGSTRSKSAKWFFNIHADSEQEEMTNLVQHSTCVLDISDDEGKAKMDGRGKENIPPVELDVPSLVQQTLAAVPRKNLLEEDPRAPLGELNAVDYYAPGCDADAFIAIYDEEPEEITEKRSLIPSLDGSVLQPSAPQPTEGLDQYILSSLKAPAVIAQDTEPTEAEFEIWESGSAAEEAATASVS